MGALSALHQVYGTIGFTSSVYEEVVTQGRRKGFSDVGAVEKAISDEWLSELMLIEAEQQFASVMLEKTSGISRTDAETIACARGQRLTLLIEDRRARNVARAEGIPYITIQVFPLYGLLERKLSASQCDNLLVQIGRAMHTDLAVVEALRAAAREISRTRRKEP